MNCTHCGTAVTADTRFCGICGQPVSATESMNDLKAVTDNDVDIVGRDVAGRYRVLAKIGEGGMGAVYRAEQISLKRTVALKLLKPSLVSTPMLLRRFNAEAEAVAKLNHPNTVGIYDFGQDSDGSLFIAMEFVDGQPLRKVVGREAPLSPQRALYIAAQIAASLADAHSHGIVHRDLKPDNVMLQNRGKHVDIARVLDFGIAKLRDDSRATAMTQAGDMLGTPQYMAPEQIKGEAIDGRTDVYALAAMLYELLTGRMVFESTTVLSILSKHLLEMPAPPSARRPDLGLPLELDQLVMAGLAKDPAHRFASMEQFGDAMMQVAATIAPMQFGGRVPAITPPAQPAVGTPLPVAHAHGAPTPMPSSSAPATVASLYAAPAPVPPPAPPSPESVPSIFAPGAQRPLASAAAVPQPKLYESAAATAPVPASGASLAQTAPRQQAVATQVVERAQPARKSRLPLVLGAILMMGGGGAGAYWYSQRSATTNDNPPSEPNNPPIANPDDIDAPPSNVPPPNVPPPKDPWAANGNNSNDYEAPPLDLQLNGNLFKGLGFKLHVPFGFDGPQMVAIPDGRGTVYTWLSPQKHLSVMVISILGHPTVLDNPAAEMHELAATMGFALNDASERVIAGKSRLFATYHKPGDALSNGADIGADATYYLTPDRTIAVYVMYPVGMADQTQPLSNEILNHRISW